MRKSLPVIAFLSLISLVATSQNTRESLVSIFNEISNRHKVTLSYDAGLVQAIKIAPPSYSTLEQDLNYVQENSAFQFVFSDEKNILIKPRLSGKNLLIRGKLTDSYGNALVGVTIAIPEQKAATFSSTNGEFELFGTLNDSDSLQISLMGFDSYSTSLNDINENGISKIVIDEKASQIEQVYVTSYNASGFNYNYKEQSIEVSVDEAALLPGVTENDILASIEALPGINSPTDKAGQLTIRGSDPDKTLLTFDNIPIYHGGHYFGTFSPFNAQVVDKIQIQRSGCFGAEEGGRLGGLIKIKSRQQLPDSARYNAGFSSSYYSVNLHAPLIKNKLGVMFGFRSSYPFNWITPKIAAIHDFVYQESEIGGAFHDNPDVDLQRYFYRFNDMNAKVQYVINENHTLDLSFLNIINNLDFGTFFNPTSNYQNDTVKLTNGGINLNYSSKWNSKLSSKISLTASRYEEIFAGTDANQQGVLQSRSYYNKEINDIRFNSSVCYGLNKHSDLSLGYQLNQHIIRGLVRRIDNGNDIVRPQDEEGGIHTLFTQYQYANIRLPFTLSAGIRTNYYDVTNKFYIEPRLIFNYFINDHVTFKANLGTYHQFINQLAGTYTSSIGGIANLNWRLSNDAVVKVAKSRQVSAGLIYEKGDFLIETEGYFREMNDITATNFIDFNSPILTIYGEYTNYGVDALIKRKWNNLEGWVSYSFNDSEARFDTAVFTYIWGQKHILSAVLGYNHKNWKFSAGWSYKSGLAVEEEYRSPFLAGRQLQPGGTGPSMGNNPSNIIYTPLSAESYGEYFPSNHQLDLSIAYQVQPKNNKYKIDIGLGLQNVYNNRIIFAQIERRTKPPMMGPPPPPNTAFMVRVNKYGIGFAPSAMINFTW